MFLSKSFKTTTASLMLLVSLNVMASDNNLPISPEQISQPYPNVKVTTLDSATALIHEFTQQKYQLKRMADSAEMPTLFVENLPTDLNTLPVAQKTSGFIRLLLPTIKTVNKRIMDVRTKVIALSAQPKSQWTKAEQVWMDNLMTSYFVKSQRIDDLLLRVNVIPVGMVLAQGIDESGWGTSHFAVNGNSLFGEHLSSKGGKYLTTPGGHVKVAAFDNLFEGTAHYMYNLNTTSAYKELWVLRQKLVEENKLSGHELVQSLSHYSTRGQAYVDNLRALIQYHQLDSFDSVEFNNTPPMRIKLAR